MSSSKYSNNLNHSSKVPCRDGKNCKRFPHCGFYHSSENTPECHNGRWCKHFPHCVFYHSPENIPECPFMEKGCTNLKCPYWHPKGYVHACIHGENCKKRDTCPYTHPIQHVMTPSHEEPLPPVPDDIYIIGDEEQTSEFKWDCSKPFVFSKSSTSSVDEHSEDDDYFIIEENGLEYLMDPSGNKVGVYTSDGRFVDLRSICIDTSDPNYKDEEEQKKMTDKMINDEMDHYEWIKMTDEYEPDSEDE